MFPRLFPKFPSDLGDLLSAPKTLDPLSTGGLWKDQADSMQSFGDQRLIGGAHLREQRVGRHQRRSPRPWAHQVGGVLHKPAHQRTGCPTMGSIRRNPGDVNLMTLGRIFGPWCGTTARRIRHPHPPETPPHPQSNPHQLPGVPKFGKLRMMFLHPRANLIFGENPEPFLLHHALQCSAGTSIR